MCFRVLQAACVFSSVLFAQADRIGIYHWGGQLTSSMSAGIERIASLGGHVARVAYSPTYYTDYGVQSGCYANYSLSSLAQEPDVQRAFDNLDIRVFILTAYDGVTFGDCRHQKFLSTSFYTQENVAALKAEYSDFVLYLFRRYAGTHRRFILSNWEGDNAVYCGAAFRYADDPAFAAQCDAVYPDVYEGNSNPEQSLEGMRRWFQARQAGIDDGVNRARAFGLSGFEVLHAPEVNIIRVLERHHLPSLLRNVLNEIHPAHVSYSSYESLNAADAGATLAEDIASIRLITGAARVIVGEASYSRSDAQHVEEISVAIKTALASGVDYFIYWNLMDQDPANSFGLFDLTNGLTPAGQLFERVLRASTISGT